MRPRPTAFAIVFAAATTACASTGAVPRPFPMTGAKLPAVASPPAFVGSPATPGPAADLYALTGTALSLRGIPYRNGGTDPGAGFDCSGFTQYVFGMHGIPLPREVKEQFETGKEVKPQALVAGDLLFFSTVAPGASHVGISLGGDEFVHAPSSSGVVRVERVTTSYWLQRFVGARRIN